MEALIPTLTISLGQSDLQILSVTMNPFFYIKERILTPWPKRTYRVWIEVMIGFSDWGTIKRKKLPYITFEFNDAFHFSGNSWPSISDRYLKSPNSGYFCETYNYSLYSHFWRHIEDKDGKPLLDKEGSYLLAGFGPKSRRVVPSGNATQLHYDISELKHVKGDARFALAFKRTPSYVATKEMKEFRGERINYPCSYNVVSRKNNTKLVIYPRPFLLHNHRPSNKMEDLKSNESISLWYSYPYTENTASYSDDPSTDHFAFLHTLFVKDENEGEGYEFPVHYFPRIPSGYEIVDSDPRLGTSPRLQRDPEVWHSGKSLYPVKPSGSETKLIHTSNDSQRLWSITLHDTQILSKKNLHIIIMSLIIAFMLRFIFKSISYFKYPQTLFFIISSLIVSVLLAFIIVIHKPDWWATIKAIRFFPFRISR
jgi:hypothetical protein